MAREENLKKTYGRFFGETGRQQMGKFTVTIDQLKGLDLKELERVSRSFDTLKETYRIAQAIGESFGNSPVQTDSVDTFRKNGSLNVLYTASGLFAQSVIDKLPLPAQLTVDTLTPDAIGLKQGVKNELSIHVGNVNIQDFIKEPFENPQAETNNPLGSYFTLLVDLVRTNNDLAVLQEIIQQNQAKKLRPDQLKLTVLSSGSLAGAMLFLHDLDRSKLVGKDRKTVAEIEKEARHLLGITSRLQGEIFTTLSNPQLPQFSSVKDSLQPYLQSQDVNINNLCILAITRGAIGDSVILYRKAQEFVDKGVEREFYQSVADAIEETAQNENQNRGTIIIITKQHVPALLDGEQAISSQEKPTLQKITKLSRNLSLPRSKKVLHVDPEVVNQSGLATPTDITIESRQDNNMLISFYYQSADGKPMEFVMQFPAVKKNPDLREFRWNVLPDPSREPQLHEAALRAAKDVINNLNLAQTEERRKKQQSRITTAVQTPPKKSYQPKDARRQAPQQKGQEKGTSMPKDQAVPTREVKKAIDRLPDDEKHKIQETIQAFNTGGGNLRKLQLLGVRGGPYYGLNVEGGKIIVMQRVGKSSNLEVVAVGTLQEAIKSLAK